MMSAAAELLVGWILIAISVAIVFYWLAIGYPIVERRLRQEETDIGDIEKQRKM